ncbi:MAG: glycoside hydrolase family 2 protein [Chloroflexi bacterium]|nr:MAG: glycoside hydrolase family 2 protein [Chloroflexota bacterium]
MTNQREVLSLNKQWYFQLGDELADEIRLHGNVQIINDETSLWQKTGNHGPSKPDTPGVDQWRQVDLPHDFVIEGEFTPEASVKTGALKRGKAIYIKHFSLPASDKGKRIHLEFDGVYRNCQIFMNGHFVGRHLSGYTSFGFDVTEISYFGGKNSLAVLVDATDNELWSYEGGGIYRSVRLVKTADVHVPQWGTFVQTGSADNPGRVQAEITVANMRYDSVSCVVENAVVFGDETAVTNLPTQTINIDAIEKGVVTVNGRIPYPQLWRLENPVQYTLITTIHVDGKLVDQYKTCFGIHFFHFDPETGFSLNGEPMKLKGVCCHQDHAAVGVAVPASLQKWRVARLKEMGVNAIRASHNPPDPALLDACDELGVLFMDEVRLPGASDEMLTQLESVLLRDRNHPSIILWSLGNEEMIVQHTEIGINMFRRMQHLAHKLDPSRPTTYAMNMMWIDICDIHDAADFHFDVWGSNYRSDQKSENYDIFHKKYPDWPMLGAETWGGAATRGLYTADKSPYPIIIGERWRTKDAALWRDPEFEGIVSAYGGTATPWGYSIEEMWLDCVKRPFMAGTFVWTGFDYRGETFPYDWPSVITRFGVLDYCGFYKEVAHYLRSWWRPKTPHLFIMPHWNWEGREGETIKVWCYSNCQTVELWLNGESLGQQEMPENFRLEWQVPYEPGELVAKGFDADGQEVLTTVRRTTGGAERVVLRPLPLNTPSAPDDVLVVAAEIQDTNGDICPLADNLITFDVTGPATILGVGNGNPVSHEPDKSNQRKAYHGLCMVYLSLTGAAGEIKLTATSPGLLDCSITM